jgi:predicted TIM-barrel fold metal-dependent hydrolase
MRVDHPIISADSHITEAPNTYTDHIDPKFRDIAPQVRETDDRGDVYVIDGMRRSIPMGLIAGAGKPAEKLAQPVRYSELHKGGYDSSYRLEDQRVDGISAELIYPSVGMVLCNHPDFDYKRAAMQAYNRWLAEYCAIDTNRLIPLGQTAMRTPEEGIADLEEMKALGMRGVMMPGNPAVEDYDSHIYDDFWEACVDLKMVPSFHILTNTTDHLSGHRGPKMANFLAIIRGCQDIIAMLVLSAVFERHPGLRVVCVEADAGWAPHFAYRMDHAYKRHRAWLTADVDRPPSYYFREHIYMTFQDDFVAFENVNQTNWHRLMWANDFPHSDSTWPWSQEMLDQQASNLTTEQRRAILCDNVAELYGIDTSVLPVGGDALAETAA